MLGRSFATATPPTGRPGASPARGLSVASWRGEAVIYRLFGTATPSTSPSVASRRGEAVIYRLFVHEMPLFHGRSGADWVLVHKMLLFHGR